MQRNRTNRIFEQQLRLFRAEALEWRNEGFAIKQGQPMPITNLANGFSGQSGNFVGIAQQRVTIDCPTDLYAACEIGHWIWLDSNTSDTGFLTFDQRRASAAKWVKHGGMTPKAHSSDGGLNQVRRER